MTGFPDRGALQPERTALAWQRTAVTSVVLLLPVLVLGVRLRLWVLAALGLLATLLGTAMVVSVRRRFAQLGDDERGYSPFVPMAAAAAVIELGAVGGVVVGLALWLP